MKNKTMLRSTPLRLYQEGAVLIVGLIMVLLITVVGLAAVRGSGMQELMAGNMRDMNLSFQGAEAGLREGETVVNSVAITSAFSGNGLWTDLYLPSASRQPIHEWTTDDWLQAGNSIEASEIDLIGTPRYVIERIVSPIGKINAADGSCIGVGCMSDLPEPEYFRVSSYSRGATPGAQTVVQSTYKTLN